MNHLSYHSDGKDSCSVSINRAYIVVPSHGESAAPVTVDLSKQERWLNPSNHEIGNCSFTKEYLARQMSLLHQQQAALVRYQIAGNFLGLPAITIPVGYDTSNLPIGLQFIGKPWDESLLIHIAFAMQRLHKANEPGLWCDISEGNYSTKLNESSQISVEEK
ncbi:hypothetical protein RND71_039564 [Anisodus tanguticus]|uniref:Amidase domain-containing protein n=1 Tax=Anisodus tanguticus TaxID=243964 RepID=A0AAE1UQS0_9SOLA|nr:hypothetical protein RND71_039564 [Anisodus tanguticus]